MPQGYAAIEFTDLVRRDIFLEAVFLWITPFLAVLLITDFAILSLFKAASFDFSPTASCTSLMTFFILVLEVLLRIRLSIFCRARFTADL